MILLIESVKWLWRSGQMIDDQNDSLANWSESKLFEDKNPSPVILGGLLFCTKSVNSAIVYLKN